MRVVNIRLTESECAESGVTYSDACQNYSCPGLEIGCRYKLASQYMATLPSFNALKARALAVNRRKAPPVPKSEFLALIAEIRSLPIPKDIRSSLCNLLRRTEKRVRAKEYQARKASWQKDLMRTRVKLGLAVYQHPRDERAELVRLLNKTRQFRGNLYHVAVGKRTALILGRDHYKAIGRLGADSRWRIHRLCKAISVYAAAGISFRMGPHQ